MSETTGNRMISMHATDKAFHIDKRMMYEAYKAVKSNRGASDVSGTMRCSADLIRQSVSRR
jgi:hypothetical protein